MTRDLLRRYRDGPARERVSKQRLGEALLTLAVTGALDVLVRMTTDGDPARLALWVGVGLFALAVIGLRRR